MEDTINIDLKEIMYNWRYEEAVHVDISSVDPRESFIRELAVIQFCSRCNRYLNVYLSPVLLQT